MLIAQPSYNIQKTILFISKMFRSEMRRMTDMLFNLHFCYWLQTNQARFLLVVNNEFYTASH